MIIIDDTIGYCPKVRKWYLYNLAQRSIGIDKVPHTYYDSFDDAVIALKTIKERYKPIQRVIYERLS